MRIAVTCDSSRCVSIFDAERFSMQTGNPGTYPMYLKLQPQDNDRYYSEYVFTVPCSVSVDGITYNVDDRGVISKGR